MERVSEYRTAYETVAMDWQIFLRSNPGSQGQELRGHADALRVLHPVRLPVR
jgi:hypothetical protein